MMTTRISVRHAITQSVSQYPTTILLQKFPATCRQTQPMIINSQLCRPEYWVATTRYYASTATEINNDNNHSSNRPYVSPFQDIFDNIKRGKTFLGTTEFQMPPETRYLKGGIPENALRFKTTAFGKLLEAPYARPNEHRVVLQVHMRYIPLNETERLVLREIVGTRLNEDTGVLQLSSSQFGSRIENKRHVVSMLERAVERAKVLASRLEEEVQQLEQA
jgi:hypothetical protein